jgi:ADP-ribosylglycohydrolase
MPEGLGGDLPRPIEETYWVLPGRLLVGEHPGSRSRADAMDRVRRFIDAGISCFIDLTEPDEVPAYEQLLPEAAHNGMPVRYVREPIVDHGLPGGAVQMASIIGTIDDALADGHNIYLHCRAGIGRSALAAGCWLAEKRGSAAAAATELNDLWRQSAQSRIWQRVPETDAQVEYLARWLGPGEQAQRLPRIPSAVEVDPAGKLRGAWYGLALGDSLGSARIGDASAARWGQATAMTLCLARSLCEVQRFDARDQAERYLRWLKEGYCSADGSAGEALATTDVARALATYRWRKQATAGSHDPKDAAATSLPRVLAIVSFARTSPEQAVTLAAESARPTHQAPVVLDACRLLAAMMCCGLQGQAPAEWLTGVCEPVPGLWQARPLRNDVVAVADKKSFSAKQMAGVPEILQVLARVRHRVLTARDFESAVKSPGKATDDAAVETALAGMLFGLRHGYAGLPAERCEGLRGREQIDAVLDRFALHTAGTARSS